MLLPGDCKQPDLTMSRSLPSKARQVTSHLQRKPPNKPAKDGAQRTSQSLQHVMSRQVGPWERTLEHL